MVETLHHLKHQARPRFAPVVKNFQFGGLRFYNGKFG
jgi:hypothetical protein